MGILAGVADCGRSWKWGCRRKLALGFKPRHGSHTQERTTWLWQTGDPMAATQLMVLGPESWTSTSFPEIQYPRLGQRKKEGLCASVGILKDFSILMKTLSHYSKSV